MRDKPGAAVGREQMKWWRESGMWVRQNRRRSKADAWEHQRWTGWCSCDGAVVLKASRKGCVVGQKVKKEMELQALDVLQKEQG